MTGRGGGWRLLKTCISAFDKFLQLISFLLLTKIFHKTTTAIYVAGISKGGKDLFREKVQFWPKGLERRPGTRLFGKAKRRQNGL